MTTLYIARHCETVWNAEKRMQGWNDSAPSEKGMLQTQALARRMSSIGIEKIYSSPTGRAFFTAQQVKASLQCELTTDERLREIHLGTWEGMLESDLKQHDAQRYHNFWKDPAQYITDGGENFADVGKRMKSFLDELDAQKSEQTVFVVSHTVAIRMLCCIIEKTPVAHLWKAPELKPTALTEIRITSGNAEVVSWADSSHLSDF